MPVFENHVTLPASAESVFEYLIRPENIQKLSPPEVQLAFVQAPEVLALGSRLVFKIFVYGQVQQFEHEIIEFDSPRCIREKALVTPMKLFVQDHLLEPTGDGQVILRNRIEFEPPGGLLGFILTSDRILSNLEDGFAHRREILLKAFA